MHSQITRAITLSQSGALPTEFLIFAPGINETEKGPVDFNARAAAEVMAALRLSSARCMIDLEHDSLSPERRAQRNDAGDARGWFTAELRPDGSLWARNVVWSPDGARRLREKTQAYISPAALTTMRDGVRQPYKLLNVALCAAPAIYDASALVAASRTAVLSARVTPAARAALYLLAAKRGTTVSVLLLSALSTIAEAGSVAPTADQMAALKALLNALGLKDAAQPEALKAINGLLQAAQSDAATPAPRPATPAPGAQSKPKPKPRSPAPPASAAAPPTTQITTLSTADRARLASLGITNDRQLIEARRAAVRRV